MNILSPDVEYRWIIFFYVLFIVSLARALKSFETKKKKKWKMLSFFFTPPEIKASLFPWTKQNLIRRIYRSILLNI